MKDPNNCPNCGAEIKKGWSSNLLVDTDKTEFINFVLGKNSKSYCDKCCYEELDLSKTQFRDERNKLIHYLNTNIDHIPILTTHSPHGWEYESLSIVTGQSVTGTGVISEFKSDFSDFFGRQSGAFNKKLAAGEELCFSQLRVKALRLGANAIIATDIDYGEAGTNKGMLMVCAAGTAIRVENTDALGKNTKIIDELIISNTRLIELDRFKL